MTRVQGFGLKASALVLGDPHELRTFNAAAMLPIGRHIDY